MAETKRRVFFQVGVDTLPVNLGLCLIWQQNVNHIADLGGFNRLNNKSILFGVLPVCEVSSLDTPNCQVEPVVAHIVGLDLFLTT